MHRHPCCPLPSRPDRPPSRPCCAVRRDSVDFVQQGALIAMALVLVEQPEARAKPLREHINRLYGSKAAEVRGGGWGGGKGLQLRCRAAAQLGPARLRDHGTKVGHSRRQRGPRRALCPRMPPPAARRSCPRLPWAHSRLVLAFFPTR
jgi:hypothetical protein